MFDTVRPAIIDTNRVSFIHPSLIALSSPLPEGWAVLKPPAGFYIAAWLGWEDHGESAFRANLLIQSIPVLDNEAASRGCDLFEEDIVSKQGFRRREPRTVVLESEVVNVEHFAATVGNAAEVTQNYFLITVKGDTPTLIVLTASAESGATGPAITTMRALCESMLGEIVGSLGAESTV